VVTLDCQFLDQRSGVKRLDLWRNSKLQINSAETLYELLKSAAFRMMCWRLAPASRAEADRPEFVRATKDKR